MSPRPISFTPEVLKSKLRALEEYGRVQTRRPVRKEWIKALGEPDAWEGDGCGAFRSFDHVANDMREFAGPFGIVGQPLWVRERARVLTAHGGPIHQSIPTAVTLEYALDGERRVVPWPERLKPPVVGHCIPNGVHREGARHFLEVVEVRAERVAEISEVDALLEGVLPVVSEHWTAYDPETDGYPSFGVEPDAEMIARKRLENVRHHGPTVLLTATLAFHRLYDSIYGSGAHQRDWCWVYTLKRGKS